MVMRQFKATSTWTSLPQASYHSHHRGPCFKGTRLRMPTWGREGTNIYSVDFSLSLMYKITWAASGGCHHYLRPQCYYSLSRKLEKGLQVCCTPCEEWVFWIHHLVRNTQETYRGGSHFNFPLASMGLTPAPEVSSDSTSVKCGMKDIFTVCNL